MNDPIKDIGSAVLQLRQALAKHGAVEGVTISVNMKNSVEFHTLAANCFRSETATTTVIRPSGWSSSREQLEISICGAAITCKEDLPYRPRKTGDVHYHHIDTSKWPQGGED